MAHDGYRGATEPPLYDHSDPRAHYGSAYYPTEQQASRSRHSSRDRGEPRAPPPEPLRFVQPQKPIDEAVSTAFNKADVSGINPELIAQITENVIKQLRTSVDVGTPVTATQQHYPPPPPQAVPQSPSTQSNTSPSVPPRNVYTPPSPQKHSEYQNYSSPESKASMPHDTPPSPKEREGDDKRPQSRASTSSDVNTSRPKGPTRLSTSKEETTLEKIWGQLFDEDGNPTVRLGQFLKGLAVHLVWLSRSRHERDPFTNDWHRLRTMNPNLVSS